MCLNYIKFCLLKTSFTMSPKSETSPLRERISTDASKSPITKQYVIQKEDNFARFEKPFGLEQHTVNIIVFTVTHTCALYYSFIYITQQVDPKSILFEISLAIVGGLGTTIGCHRFWTHKTFKANLPLQIILMLMQTITLQYPIFKWVLDHRIHHKYTDTHSDPHNSKRGFWFSHIGWLVLPKRKELSEKLKAFDMPDLENDPIINFQARWYPTLIIVFHLLAPMSVYYYLFNMPLLYCFMANCRCFVINLHATFCVNSVAHLWGDKPYDKNISSVENKFVALLAVGEGWHNYHHSFPWDYRASEFAWKLNVSTMLIDFFAWIGWAWDMKTVSEKIIHEKMNKTGDGSRIAPNGNQKIIRVDKGLEDNSNSFDDSKPEVHVWGWDDENITDDMREITLIINPE